MDDFVVGFIIGILIGISLGIAIEVALGIRQKPWSALTEEEKKNRKNAICLGTLTLFVEIIVFVWFLLT
jgi:hypothetical protein